MEPEFAWKGVEPAESQTQSRMVLPSVLEVLGVLDIKNLSAYLNYLSRESAYDDAVWKTPRLPSYDNWTVDRPTSPYLCQQMSCTSRRSTKSVLLGLHWAPR